VRVWGNKRIPQDSRLTDHKGGSGALAEQIREEISTFPNLEDILGALEIKVEADGLVVEIMDTEKRSMFALSSAKVNPEAKEAFTQVAGLLAQFSNKLDVIGHTDARPFSSRRNGGYSNWELSAGGECSWLRELTKIVS